MQEVIGIRHLDDLEHSPDLPSRFTYFKQLLHHPRRTRRLLECVLAPLPPMTTTLHHSKAHPTSQSRSNDMRSVCSKASPSGIPWSSPSERWIGPGDETASSAAGLLALTVAGWARGVAGYRWRASCV